MSRIPQTGVDRTPLMSLICQFQSVVQGSGESPVRCMEVRNYQHFHHFHEDINPEISM